MADINSSKRQDTGLISKGLRVDVRAVTFDVDFANDFTMTAVGDVIFLGTLPKGTVVLAGHLIQTEAGTGSGTQKLTLEDAGGTQDVTGTANSTAAAGTVEVNTLATAYTCDADTEVTLVNATAVRTDGKLQAVLYVCEGYPVTFPASASRDYLA